MLVFYCFIGVYTVQETCQMGLGLAGLGWLARLRIIFIKDTGTLAKTPFNIEYTKNTPNTPSPTPSRCPRPRLRPSAPVSRAGDAAEREGVRGPLEPPSFGERQRPGSQINGDRPRDPSARVH